MVKLTKRKGFNFFRSYYDVYNELENNADKVAFIEALLDRQFLGVKPLNLKGMAKFAYISQTNSIDSQVKGYEDKTKTILHPVVGGCVGVVLPPSLQVQEEVEEKVEVQDVINNLSVDWVALLKFFNDVTGRSFKVVSAKAKKQIKDRLKEGYSKEDLVTAINNCFNDKYHQDNRHFLTLEFISRSDKMEKFATDCLKPKLKQDRL
jgi:uncharacterized phage protein (TIGR02220 family)